MTIFYGVYLLDDNLSTALGSAKAENELDRLRRIRYLCEYLDSLQK